ncbi:MAG: hypothetical protein AB2556_24035, partial [Candidatus Thiodiazotropha sp.]
PLDIGDIEVADGIHARAGRLALDARMTDERAVRLDSFPERVSSETHFFVSNREVSVTLFVWRERRDRPSLRSRDTKPGVLTGIDRVFNQNACLLLLPNLRSRPGQPCPTKRWRPQLCGPESCGAL